MTASRTYYKQSKIKIYVIFLRKRHYDELKAQYPITTRTMNLMIKVKLNKEWTNNYFLWFPVKMNFITEIHGNWWKPICFSTIQLGQSTCSIKWNRHILTAGGTSINKYWIFIELNEVFLKIGKAWRAAVLSNFYTYFY